MLLPQMSLVLLLEMGLVLELDMSLVLLLEKGFTWSPSAKLAVMCSDRFLGTELIQTSVESTKTKVTE